ncbi:hypothetical protein ACPUYX_11615 [Desulfosporosinus sp. SYSU MS00001]|uniref:hypothetical protein n=1 Tax=Desulfosporosinus sp. SYSU MS00001 TaxID=3416284 RepID=UPI003CFB9287
MAVTTVLGFDRVTLNGKYQYEISARIFPSGKKLPGASGDSGGAGSRGCSNDICSNRRMKFVRLIC